MNYDERLSNVSVLGAAGKMGSGILLLTAVEMADLSFKKDNGNLTFILNAIDISDKALAGLLEYVRVQSRKIAEKKINFLREIYADNHTLIYNNEIIDDYIHRVLAIIRPSTLIESTYNSNVIFEAVNENPNLKIKLIKQIDENSNTNPWFFTNTSSVPISYLNEKGDLDGRIIGFHFYNPPAVQKLVELINGEDTVSDLNTFALEYAKKLRKVIIHSNDIAGFIGNGHFMRDALLGIRFLNELKSDYGFPEALYVVNKVSQDFMIRPMGIFQLVDYVGIDVCMYIMEVMNPYFNEENIHSDLLDQLFERGVKGGQNSDGSQKDGFMKYNKGRIIGIFDYYNNTYVDYDAVSKKMDLVIGKLPNNHIIWKEIIKVKDRDDLLKTYFENLSLDRTLGSIIAKKYMKGTREIGLKLVEQKVAKTERDVNDVMLTGFFHSYGPINNFLPWEEI
ncbi:MAG: 3-hydroxyacyl-CoA dehydrogenase family protein [Bacteroidetes bacterium]|nr:3-hydroxyacyl-CoA dehydrogenase family protein [Bacteroidota bacterium]MBU1114077.1 3-hydroxyacyl-CoA dehydrogenase family protein [Bacteroidota bacterium]MBU1798272.1 3-hydroxyacyl-CoA dehydrogenase family protein [Bacteroidota bacterium]